MKVARDKVITEEDIELFKSLIIEYRKNVKLTNMSEKLLWKDFLLYFKETFEDEIGGLYTGKISIILRQLLHIDQNLHVRQGIQLTFREWMDFYIESPDPVKI